MSNSLNKVQLIGNMTANAEIKQTPSGVSVATFSLATNKSWKDENGNKQESVEFHNCVAWRGLAEILEKYMSKGKKLYVEGELKTRTWDDQDGIKRYKTEIVASNIILLSGGERSSGSRDEDAPPAPPPTPTRARKKPDPDKEISIEDIPF